LIISTNFAVSDAGINTDFENRLFFRFRNIDYSNNFTLNVHLLFVMCGHSPFTFVVN